MTGEMHSGAASAQLHVVLGSVLTSGMSGDDAVVVAHKVDLTRSRRHPKGLDASGGGSWSRQKHERATQTAIVLEDLKTVRLARWKPMSSAQAPRPAKLAEGVGTAGKYASSFSSSICMCARGC